MAATDPNLKKIYDRDSGLQYGCDKVGPLKIMNAILRTIRGPVQPPATDLLDGHTRVKLRTGFKLNIWQIQSYILAGAYDTLDSGVELEDMMHATATEDAAVNIAKYGLAKYGLNALMYYGFGYYVTPAVWTAMVYSGDGTNKWWIVFGRAKTMKKPGEKYMVGKANEIHPPDVHTMANMDQNPNIMCLRLNIQFRADFLVELSLQDWNITADNLLTLGNDFNSPKIRQFILGYKKRESDGALYVNPDALPAAAAVPALPAPPAPPARVTGKQAKLAVAGAMVKAKRKKVKYGVAKWPGERVKKRKTAPAAAQAAQAAQAPAAAAAAAAPAAPGANPLAPVLGQGIALEFLCRFCGIVVKWKGTTNPSECQRQVFFSVGGTDSCCGCDAARISNVQGQMCSWCNKRGKAKAQPQAAPAAAAVATAAGGSAAGGSGAGGSGAGGSGAGGSGAGRSGAVGGSAAGGSGAVGGSGVGGSGGGGGSRPKVQGPKHAPASMKAPMPAPAAPAAAVDLTVDSTCTTAGCPRFTQYGTAEPCCPLCTNGGHTWWCNDTEKMRLASEAASRQQGGAGGGA